MPEPRRSATLRADIIGVALLAAGAALFLPPLLRPLAAQTPDERQEALQATCSSNLEKVAKAMLMYIQDYDEVYPLAGKVAVKSEGKTYEWNDILAPYLKTDAALRCPAVSTTRSPVTYLYNDLLTAREARVVTSAENTLLVVEGEDVTPNVGHAWMKDYPPAPAVIGRYSRVAAGNGARVQNAPTRHRGGANYAYADGHMRWMKPELVYFPPRSTNTVLSSAIKGAPKIRESNGTFLLRDRGAVAEPQPAPDYSDIGGGPVGGKGIKSGGTPEGIGGGGILGLPPKGNGGKPKP